MAKTNVQWKLRRAREHFHTFHEIRRWWFETEPYRIAEEIDAKADMRSIVVLTEREPPIRMSLIIGELIQSLRSALDYLIADIARETSGGYLMPAVEKDLMFPITSSRDNFRAQRRRGRLGCVPPRTQARIQKLQPYRAGDNWRRTPLWVLHELSNIDKHRSIPLFLSVLSGVSFNEITFENVRAMHTPTLGPFVGKAQLFGVSPADAKVDVDLESIHVDVAFGEGHPVEGLPVEGVIEELLNWVGRTAYGLAAFTGHLIHEDDLAHELEAERHSGSE